MYVRKNVTKRIKLANFNVTVTPDQCFLDELEEPERYSNVSMFLLALFMLVGNVILLNMIIAVFT